MCGASLAPRADVREERKVVTVLFCDLVGFTQRAEQLDPEDVRALLTPYHQRVGTEAPPACPRPRGDRVRRLTAAASLERGLPRREDPLCREISHRQGDAV